MDFNINRLVVIILLTINSKTGICQTPIIIINNEEINVSADISFPFWLNSGSSINPGRSISLISIIEFNSTTDLSYNKIINLDTFAVVPNGKVWKVESVGLIPNSTTLLSTKPSAILSSPAVMSDSKSFWIVPINTYQIAIELWGPGGDGYPGSCCGNAKYGQGGASGGYGYEVFNVRPMDTIFWDLSRTDTGFVWGAGFFRFATAGEAGKAYCYDLNTGKWIKNNTLIGGNSNFTYHEKGNNNDNDWQGSTGNYATSNANCGSCDGVLPGGGGAGGQGVTTYGKGAKPYMKIHF